MPADLGKDMHINQKTSLNNSGIANSHSKSFNNVSFPTVIVPGNMSNLNLVYSKNTSLINNMREINVIPNMSINQKNYSSINNLIPNLLVQNSKNNDKINNNLFLNQDKIKNNDNYEKNNYQKSGSNNLINQSANIEKSFEIKSDIILPPTDDFIPPLPPENPPEPDSLKIDELEQLSCLKETFYKHDIDKKDDRLGEIIKEKINPNFMNAQLNSSNFLEKNEPGQISNYNSEEESFANTNANKLDYRSRKIDVKNAPINIKKYNFSRSSSSSSHSYIKKDYLNKKRDREKIHKYSREREKNKDKKKKKHRSRSKERNNNNISSTINFNKISNGIISKRENRECKIYSRNDSNKKHHERNNIMYHKQENKSSSSSSFQSGKFYFI